jgi:hypothetical protein
MPSASVHTYDEVMTQPEVHAGLAEVMATHGRPVAPDGLDRAKRTLRAAELRRDPAARAAALEELRRSASAA